ncbi:MAG TPA: response regulator [Verrucomicrobiae bacterium]|jgi:HD-like signal output (HDOD) protein
MKRCIYVVDDQTAVLDTAVLILRGIDAQWQVTGFSDPQAALAAVMSQAPDLILSDQLMPGILGSQLLEKVRSVAPAAIRVIMSGYVSLNKLTLITSAHQYIAKPFDIGKLRDIVQRSFAAQERIINKGLQTVATSLRSIPSLPQVHQSLLAELEDNRTANSVIARMVSEDAGLSIKVLQLANSPLFGQGYLITNPSDAVMCLGTEMIAAIVLSQSLFRHYESLKHSDLDVARIWSHCWETAYMGQHICRQKRLPRRAAEEVFLAGLLHEAGRFILVDNFPEQFSAACQHARQTKTALAPRLLEAFQTTPAQLTAYLMELWGMPSEVVTAISLQDNPHKEPSGGFCLASALYVADHLAARKAPPDNFALEDWNAEYLRKIGCEEDLPGWLDPSFPAENSPRR